jgi:hypothetical protein
MTESGLQRGDFAGTPAATIADVMQLPYGLVLALALASGLASAGCIGPAAREAAHAAAPAMVDGAVEGVADKDNQRKLANGIDEEAVEKIAERLSGKIVDGTMQALSEPERRKLVAEAFRDVRVPIGMEGAMDIRVATIDPQAVAGAVDAAMSKALERVDETKMKGLVHGIVDEAVRTAFSSARDELQKSETPTQNQVASLTRTISKEATLGFQDAVDEARRSRDQGETQPGEGSVLWAASRAAESGNTLLDVWKVSLLAVGLVLIAGFVWAFRQHRTHRRELLQRDEALALLTKKVEETSRRSSAPGQAPPAAPGESGKDGERPRPSLPGRPHFA